MRVVVNIDVPELGPAIEFYCAALELEHSRTLDDDVAELAGASSMIYLRAKARWLKCREQTPRWPPLFQALDDGPYRFCSGRHQDSR